ncbi:MAG: pyrroline-5-carboxylate reductase [Clostridia bacterium]|nr:pyrroline-5-carboxylate reductase [Clostridia bacterium]
MKIGFIGFGNMASAIAYGMTASKEFDYKDMVISDHNEIKVKAATLKGAKFYENENEVVKESDILILAVKPHAMKDLLIKIKDEINEKNPLIISVATGLELKFFEEILGDNISLIRTIPNLNAKVLMSVTAVCQNENVTKEQREIFDKIFKSFGYIFDIPEKDFSAFGVLVGCGIAYTFLFYDSMARAAVKFGIKKDLALKAACLNAKGAAELINQTNIHPAELIDMTCSPNGTTIEGIASLLNENFQGAIINAFEKSYLKDQKMGK